MTLVDADTLFEDFLEEMACVATGRHNGRKAALINWHGCYVGPVCEKHYKEILAMIIPRVECQIDCHGTVTCAACRQRFTSVDAFIRVVVL